MDRGEEQIEVQEEGDERSRGEMTARDEPGADAEHDGVAAVGQELDEGEVRRDEPLRVDTRVKVGRPRRRNSAMLASSCTNACVSRTPERLSWKLAFTAAMRSLASS